MASKNGHLSVVERLLQDPRVDPSDDDNYAFCMAAENGHSSVVERLLMDPRVVEEDHNIYNKFPTTENLQIYL